MSDFVYYYFCKKLSECSEMLIEMDISEEKRDELNNEIQNVIDKLYSEERQMKVVIEIDLDDKLVKLFEKKMKDYDRNDLIEFIREDMEGLIMNELDESLEGYGFLNY